MCTVIKELIEMCTVIKELIEMCGTRSYNIQVAIDSTNNYYCDIMQVAVNSRDASYRTVLFS